MSLFNLRINSLQQKRLLENKFVQVSGVLCPLLWLPTCTRFVGGLGLLFLSSDFAFVQVAANGLSWTGFVGGLDLHGHQSALFFYFMGLFVRWLL
jgi:hypothetical protein